MIIKVGGLEPLGPIGVYAYDAEQGLCNGRASVSFIIQLGDNRDVPPRSFGKSPSTFDHFTRSRVEVVRNILG